VNLEAQPQAGKSDQRKLFCCFFGGVKDKEQTCSCRRNLAQNIFFAILLLDTSTGSVQAQRIKSQGSKFLFVRKLFSSYYLQLVANNFNSFLKLKFFKNVLTEILKITSFSAVAKT
jgi:hypothetical protein